MQIKLFEIFLKLLKTKSFSQTAKAFGLAQPSVSAAIKSLEKSFGQKLFERTPRKVIALPSAETLADFATRIVETAGQAAWALNHQLPNTKEKLTIGASTVPSLIFVPAALSKFQSKYPKVYLKLTTRHSAEIIRMVTDGILDLGLVGANPDNDQLLSVHYSSDKLVLVSSNTLAKSIGILPKSQDDLINWPLIVREDGSGTRAAFLASLTDNGANFKFKAEIDGLAPAMALVRASFAATIMSNLLPPILNLHDLTVMELGFETNRSFFLIRRQERLKSPVVEAMFNVFEDIKDNFSSRY